MKVNFIKHLFPLAVIVVVAAGCAEASFEDEDLTYSAVGQLEESMNNGNLEDEVFEYEEVFSQNDYAGDVNADEQVEVVEGDGNVLISAPHTTTHVRDGDVRDAEIYTGSIAFLVQEYTDAHLIYNVYEGEDHNHIVGGEYKERIGDTINDNDIDLVIDLHGAEGSRDFDLDIGTNYGETVSDEQVDLLECSLENNDIHDVYENDTFPASDEGTITRHTWEHFDTEAMQLEIHSDYRDPRNDFESYAQMLGSLTFFVDNVG